MTADPKLIETVARAMRPVGWETPICGCDRCLAMYEDDREQAKELAELALFAIDASGEWWLVERKKIDGIANEFIDVPPQQDANPVGFHAGWEFCARAFHGALRTAYLAKTEETTK